MRAAMRRALLLTSTLLAAASCYSPQITSGLFRCDRPEDVCPAGYYCIDNRCQDPTQIDMAPPADLAMADRSVPVDLTEPPDLLDPADLRPPPPDLSGADLSTPACSRGGYLLATAGAREIFACIGNFATATESTQLCGSGYRRCNKDDDMLFKAARDNGECEKTDGFFAADVQAVQKGNGDTGCETTSGGQPMLLGCGLGTNIIKAKQRCNELELAMRCDSEAPGWSCTTALNDARNMSGEGGVLCCK